MVSRGEIWWYEHPAAGRRPFLVLSRPVAIPMLNQVIAVPATRNVRGIPTEVTLDESDGMPDRCALTLDNLGLIRPSLCTDRVTTLGPAKMAAVCEALHVATGC